MLVKTAMVRPLMNMKERVHVAFLFAKARVAPLKPITIPRLELTAAVVVVRVDKMLQLEFQLPLTKACFWTDSTSVLKYIKNENRRFQTFVANRIATIRDNSPYSSYSTFLRTEKHFMKDTMWKEAYMRQDHEMVGRGAAVQVILLKGPDILNPIRAVMLRFQEGEHAAIGDITKRYNSVWLEEREVHVHWFLWRDSPKDEMEDYTVMRVNMGDKPAECIMQVAMRETAKLPQFSDMKEERRVIE